MKYYYKALAIIERVLGKEHPNTATSYNNIGRAYYDQGDYAHALEYLNKALPVYERVYGPEHDNTQNLRSWIEATESHLKK